MDFRASLFLSVLRAFWVAVVTIEEFRWELRFLDFQTNVPSQYLHVSRNEHSPKYHLRSAPTACSSSRRFIHIRFHIRNRVNKSGSSCVCGGLRDCCDICSCLFVVPGQCTEFLKAPTLCVLQIPSHLFFSALACRLLHPGSKILQRSQGGKDPTY